MIREAFGVGDTIEIAKKKAREELGVDETAEVNYDVIDLPIKKTLGLFGGTPAKIRAWIEASPAKNAENFLRDVLEKMGAKGIDLSTTEEEGGAVITLSGDGVGMVIGRRGETLDALQYLTGLVANHSREGYFRVSLNTGNYREKREKTLEGLAKKMAFKAIKTGRNQFLEPMNPYERRIIHKAVQEVNGAKSWSEGEDTKRHVVVGPENPGAARPYSRPPRSNFDSNRGGSRFNNSEGGYRKPYNRDSSSNSEGGYRKPYNRDNSEGYRKPYNRDGDSSNSSSNEGYRKPYNRDGDSSDSYRKPYNQDNRNESGESRPPRPSYNNNKSSNYSRYGKVNKPPVKPPQSETDDSE